MEYKGISDRNVALQYFNKTCCECGKNVRQNDVLAMNLKFHGRNTNKIYCKKCLMKQLGMDKEEWDKRVEDFKPKVARCFKKRLRQHRIKILQNSGKSGIIMTCTKLRTQKWEYEN